MLKKLFVSQKGFSFPAVILAFLVAAVVSYALIVRQSTHVVLHTQQEGIDKAVHLADTGIEIAISNLRIDPNYTRSPNDNVTDPVEPQFNGKGEIIFTVDTLGYNEVVVISSGIYKAGNEEYKKAVKAIFKVESPGEYFLASATTFKIGPSSGGWATLNKGNGIIYGNIIEFLPGGEGVAPATVFRVQYVSECINSPYAYYKAENGDEPPQGVSGTYPDGYPEQPEKFPGKNLPVISDELMEHYANIGELFPSTYDSGSAYGAGGFMGGNALKNNPTEGTTVWYCPGDLTIKWMHYEFHNTTGCVIAVNGNLYIEGCIINEDYDPSNPDDGDSSNDYGLAFIVKKNVIISSFAEGGWMAIERVLFVATNGKFTVGFSATNVPIFRFSGAAMFRDSFDINRGFAAQDYRYEPIVRYIEDLPYMVSMKSYQPITK